MNNKMSRLEVMYKYALSNELCKNKSSFAALLGVNSSSLSRAFGGEEKYLSDTFLIRVNSALGNVFSMDWVLNGKLPMMKDQISQTISTDAYHENHINMGDLSGDNNIIGSHSVTSESKISLYEYQRIIAEKDRQIEDLKKQRDSFTEQVNRLLAIIENMQTK